MSQSDIGGQGPLSSEFVLRHGLREQALHWQFEEVEHVLYPLDGTVQGSWEEDGILVCRTHYQPVEVHRSPMGNRGLWEVRISKQENILPEVGAVSLRRSLVAHPLDHAARRSTEAKLFRRPRLFVQGGVAGFANANEVFHGETNYLGKRQATCAAWLGIVTEQLLIDGHSVQPFSMPPDDTHQA